MKVHYSLDNLPEFRDAVLTIGVFDGVHHGHRAIINKVIEKAKEIGGESVLMTFNPHPRKVVFPNDNSLRLISTLEEKIKLLGECGIDHLIVAPFTVEFSQINPYVYTEKILMEKIKARHIIIGYDHRFGLNRSGDINLLKAYADEGYFSLDEIPKQDIDNLTVSSSKIRMDLLHGNIKQANKQLEHPFILSGRIKKGLKTAGKMGYPTANIEISNSDKLIPAFGTYAAECLLDGQKYEGMCYIGESKTLQQEGRLSVEMNVFHMFDQEFYEEALEIHLLDFIRKDLVFSSKKELIFNIEQDKIACEIFFNQRKNSDKVRMSIAILNWNGVEYLQEYLPTLEKSSKDKFKIILIDNASTDGSIGYVRENHGNIEIVQLDKNYGFAEGYNLGLKHITTPYVALVNSDVEGTEYWLDPLIARLEDDLQLGAIQPKILAMADRDSFEYAGASGGFMDLLGYPFCRGRILDVLEADEGQYDTFIETFWTTGAAMVIRTDLLHTMSGFDSDFFAHMEEIDLCWRMKKAGYKIAVEPQSKVYHLGGGTLQYKTPQKTFLNFRNNWWMILKNESIKRLIWIIPIRFIMDILYALKSTISNSKESSAVIRALWAVVSSLRATYAKREKNFFMSKRFRSVENRRGRLNIILPISFYLLRNRKFDTF